MALRANSRVARNAREEGTNKRMNMPEAACAVSSIKEDL